MSKTMILSPSLLVSARGVARRATKICDCLCPLRGARRGLYHRVLDGNALGDLFRSTALMNAREKMKAEG